MTAAQIILCTTLDGGPASAEPAEGTVEYRRACILADIEWQTDRLSWARVAHNRAVERVEALEAHIARREAELAALPP